MLLLPMSCLAQAMAQAFWLCSHPDGSARDPQRATSAYLRLSAPAWLQTELDAARGPGTAARLLAVLGGGAAHRAGAGRRAKGFDAVAKLHALVLVEALERVPLSREVDILQQYYDWPSDGYLVRIKAARQLEDP
ncbi:unnamed protein product, partial [Prorocentrum cordatum]